MTRFQIIATVMLIGVFAGSPAAYAMQEPISVRQALVSVRQDAQPRSAIRLLRGEIASTKADRDALADSLVGIAIGPARFTTAKRSAIEALLLAGVKEGGATGSIYEKVHARMSEIVQKSSDFETRYVTLGDMTLLPDTAANLALLMDLAQKKDSLQFVAIKFLIVNYGAVGGMDFVKSLALAPPSLDDRARNELAFWARKYGWK